MDLALIGTKSADKSTTPSNFISPNSNFKYPNPILTSISPLPNFPLSLVSPTLAACLHLAADWSPPRLVVDCMPCFSPNLIWQHGPPIATARCLTPSPATFSRRSRILEWRLQHNIVGPVAINISNIDPGSSKQAQPHSEHRINVPKSI